MTRLLPDHPIKLPHVTSILIAGFFAMGMIIGAKSTGQDKDACKGIVVKVGKDLRLTFDDHPNGETALCWTGSEFGVTWDERIQGKSTIHFTRVSSLGMKIGPNLEVCEMAGFNKKPAISWTGSEYGVVWQWFEIGGWDVYFQRLSSEGSKIGPAIKITQYPKFCSSPQIIWTGSEFGLAWEEVDSRDGKYEIYFRRLAPSGQPIGPKARLTYNQTEDIFISLAWTGSEFGLSWNTRRPNPEVMAAGSSWDSRKPKNDLFFQRLASSGEIIGPALQLSGEPEWNARPCLAWTGSEWGIVWANLKKEAETIIFVRLSGDGEKIEEDKLIVTDPPIIYDNPTLVWAPALVWAGSEFGLSWLQGTDTKQIYFVRLSPKGEKIGSIFKVYDKENYSRKLVWTGSEYALAWSGTQDHAWETFFTRLTTQASNPNK